MYVTLQSLRLIEPSQAMKELGLVEHQIRFTSTITLDDPGPPTATTDKVYRKINECVNWEFFFQNVCA